jgi:hypothetical protein
VSRVSSGLFYFREASVLSAVRRADCRVVQPIWDKVIPSVNVMFGLLQRVEESGLFLWSVWLIVESRVKVNRINYREGAAGEISGC